MPHWPLLSISFLLPLLLSALLTPLARRLGQRAGWHVRSGDRHIHEGAIPRSGGLAMVLALSGMLLLLLRWPIERPAGESIRIGLLALGSLLAFALLLWDDIREMAPWPKLTIQFGVAAVAVLPYFLAPQQEPAPGFVITQVQNPLASLLGGETIYLPLLLAVPLTFFWIVGMMNVGNVLDGLDGLAAGVTAIAALLMFLHTFLLKQYSLAPLPLALAGACLGFLPYNFHPARIFMGDSGAMFLGYALAILSIIGGAKIATALLVLGVPILDVAWRIIFRLSQGRSFAQADREHLHHRLLDLGLSQVQIVLLFYVFCGGFGALAIFLPKGLYKLYALVLIGLGISALLWWLARRQPGRIEDTNARTG
ncbi:MAG: undecaprenyl/decaprenyl-phosphate alpha-N-acetylglucosaminyl 1-phosphate transferase [Chloroflexia bacterium]|nr:undecaprenyl/decaprenyl-phosphate alpha-N-acetylglucosaminyl 1-phosphate transferase [Chloroflexia bacterium]